LALLLLVLCIQLLRRETTFPRAGALTPLTALLLVALGTSLLGILLSPVPMRDQVVTGRVLRAGITLLMGAGFFVGAIWMNREQGALRFSVRWMLAGFALDVVWSGLQARYSIANPAQTPCHPMAADVLARERSYQSLPAWRVNRPGWRANSDPVCAMALGRGAHSGPPGEVPLA
jgi:hypothetical protein